MNDEFKKKVIALAGEAGERWLVDLPNIVSKYEFEWNIKAQPSFPLSYNYVCPAAALENRPVVLKISFPGNKEFVTEIAALKTFNKEVSVQILREDLLGGAVLLERAMPGLNLSKVEPDELQVHLAAQVIGQLHTELDQNSLALFPTLADWAKVFDRYKEKYSINDGPIPKEFFDLGEGIFKEFLQDKKEQVVLHGDLHSDNIISSERGWLVIDPKGVIGEKEFELGAYLRNPYYDFLKGCDYKKIEAARISQFAEELGFEKERIRGWALVCAIISLLWFLEDEGTVNEIYLRNAELIRNLKL